MQGPPGSGKTFQASNAIIELLKKNKKIAVTANSHKVIHTLLERVEKLASEQKYIFKGLKKGNPDDSDTFYDGKFIKTERNERHYIDGLNNDKILLYAGTKYHLAQPFYQNTHDWAATRAGHRKRAARGRRPRRARCSPARSCSCCRRRRSRGGRRGRRY